MSERSGTTTPKSLALDEKYLEKALRAVTKSGKYVVGVREVAKNLRGSKLVVYCTSRTGPVIDQLVSECKSASIPAFKFEPGSVKLGRLCGKSFRISALAIKSGGEADLKPILENVK